MCASQEERYRMAKRSDCADRKGRGTDGGLFAIRQNIEKRRDFRKNIAFGFVDLEKAIDTVPRDLAFAVMIWMEVGYAEC